MTAKQEERTESQLITDAIGAHGIFFKKALRRHLEATPGVRILGEEYPIKYLEGGSIDLLLEYRSGGQVFVLPVECKRALATRKKWVFFRDCDQLVKLYYHFSVDTLRVNNSGLLKLTDEICVEGVEVDLDKLRNREKGPFGAASPDRIWKAAFQACKAGHGFMREELRARAKNGAVAEDFIVFMLVITTAPLEVADLQAADVDLSQGNHRTELATREVPWLILNHPFTPSEEIGVEHLRVNSADYVHPTLRGLHSKEGIVIVNAGHIRRFFELLGCQIQLAATSPQVLGLGELLGQPQFAAAYLDPASEDPNLEKDER